MYGIVVSNFFEARDKFTAFHVTHAVSFKGGQHNEYPDLAGVVPDANWLRIHMPDSYFETGTPAYQAAERIVEELILFGRRLPEDANVGFNCLAGISRSTAAALIVSVVREGFEAGTELFWKSVRMSAPNQTLIEIADRLLDLNGNLIAFVKSSVERYYNERRLSVLSNLLKLANESEESIAGENLAQEYTAGDVDKPA